MVTRTALRDFFHKNKTTKYIKNVYRTRKFQFSIRPFAAEITFEASSLMVVLNFHQIISSSPDLFLQFVAMESSLIILIWDIRIIICRENPFHSQKSSPMYHSYPSRLRTWMKKELDIFDEIMSLHISFKICCQGNYHL